MILFNMKDYILYAPRDSFLSANREGIIGTFGLLFISLI